MAIFIFVNSLIAIPIDENQKVTADGWVAVGSVVICIVVCFVLARVAAKQVNNSAYRLQGWMFVIALLIWIYAMDAEVLHAIRVQKIPALSGLLLVTFTVFSGLLVPTIEPADARGQGVANPTTRQKSLSDREHLTTDLKTGGNFMTN